jgi:tetratricopeptide (TPR) repeat protein
MTPGEGYEQLTPLRNRREEAPRLGAAHELRVDVLADAGRVDEALAAARAPILAGHVPRGLRLKAARLQAERGERAEARVAVEELLAAEPDFTDAWAQLAQWHEDAGRHEDAIAAARRLVRLGPSDPVPHAYLARALLGGGEREAGKAELRRAIALDPGYEWAVQRLLDAELEDGSAEGAAELLPIVSRHAPDDAAMVRARIAAARGDAQAALGDLDALAREEDRDRLDVAAKANAHAGWVAELEARLDALLAEPSAARTAGALFSARAVAKGWPRARRRRLDAALSAAAPTPAALGAAEARLDQLAKPSGWLPLLRFVRRHRAALAADADTWASVGYALSSAGRHRRAAAWLAGWRARSGLKPWMLLNLVLSLRELGRDGEAAEAGRAAVALAPDHTTPMHEVMLALDAALAGEPGAAGRLGREHRTLGAHYRCLVALVEVGQRLVSADVDRAEHHRLLPGQLDDLAVQPQLPLAAGQGGRDEELEFGAEQADSIGPRHVERGRILGQAGVDHDADRDAVLGHRRKRADLREMGAALLAERHPVFEPRQELAVGSDDDAVVNEPADVYVCDSLIDRPEIAVGVVPSPQSIVPVMGS